MVAAGLDGGYFTNVFSNDGNGADTIGYGGYATKSGFPAGFSKDINVIKTGNLHSDDQGKFFCIDSAFYPPGGEWLWNDGVNNIYPSWNGPKCWAILLLPDPPATITNCGDAPTLADHCSVYQFDFNATDAGPGADPNALVWAIVSGPGSIDPSTGVYSAAGSLPLVGAAQVVQIKVTDAGNNVTTCDFAYNFTNQAPTIACQGQKAVGKGNSIDVDINASNVDCDPGTFSIVGVNPAPLGSYSIDPNTGLLTFNTDVNDCGFVYDFTVEYSDGNMSAQCVQKIEVLCTEPFGIFIEKTHMTFQGGHEYVDVSIFKGSEPLYGFDILIAYDASALSFQAALEGEIYDSCGWEYFTYRYGAAGNCDGGCPSGLLRVVGIAETNNGANHPDCFGTVVPYTLFTLDFLVTDNRLFECQYLPVRFFWLDCGDNTVSYHETAAADPYSQTLGISSAVYDYAFDAAGVFDPNLGMLIPLGAGFPNYGGAPEVCETSGGLDKPEPVRFIDFYNGGIDVACADSIDARGDLNLDGQANTIADAVLFSNYFVYGIGVFTVNVQGQIAASDVNADGIALSVGDLVYLIRIVVGDALPYPKLSPVTANVTYDGTVVSVSERLGAAALVVEGNVTPELLASGVEMKYAYDATENVTRVIVVGMEKDAAFSGAFIDANGPIVSIEMATYEGAPVTAKMVPSTFVLNQNYPNPFNPSTTISFGLPTASEYTVTVYNVTGQVVRTINGHSDAGTVNVLFDASSLSSGIYFYNVSAGSFSATEKMVLIK
jgi:hypothetical protein